jgi:hypothetical protein
VLDLTGAADMVAPSLDDADGRAQLLEEIRQARRAVEMAVGGRIVEPDEFAERFEEILNRERSPWEGLVDLDSLEIDGVRVWPNGRKGQGEK